VGEWEEREDSKVDGGRKTSKYKEWSSFLPKATSQA